VRQALRHAVDLALATSPLKKAALRMLSEVTVTLPSFSPNSM
jgi:hypothetical protein